MSIAYQIGAFQAYAYQTISGIPSNDNGWLGGGDPKKDSYSYHSPNSLYEQEQREKIRKRKSELQKLESVLEENQRKKALAERSRIEAQALKRKQAEERLIRFELELQKEINRLLAVRAELIRRVQEEEALLLIILMMRRRRLRAA